MKISEIYEKYMAPKNLQEHMLRVAATAEIILENWTGNDIDQGSVVQASLLHDIAKPMTFDLAKQAQFGMSPDDIAKLKNLQDRLKNDYGNEEHPAVVKICTDIGLTPNAIKCIDNSEWKYLPRLLEAQDTASLILIYCDMRIGPKGILLISQRLDDLKSRTQADDYEDNLHNGNAIEKLLQSYTSINLNTITDDQLNQRFVKLLGLEV